MSTVIGRERIFSGESYQRELDTVFAASWLFIGHESEIPRPGDWVTRAMATDRQT